MDASLLARPATEPPAEPAPARVLEASGLHLAFGKIQALAGVDFAIGAGELVSIIGPNGAGKSSLLNCLSGFYRRKRVDLGRALAIEPKVLILDEPMAGMNADEKADLARYILDVNEGRGVPVVLVEHDMEVVMDISDRVMVLEWGRTIADGTPAQV